MGYCLAAALVAVCLCWVAPGARSAVPVRPTPRLTISLQRSGEAAHVLSDGRYAFAAPANPAQPGVLFDDLHKRQRTIAQQGCLISGSEIFGGVLSFDCSSSEPGHVRVYLIASREWRQVTVSPQIVSPCGSIRYCDGGSELVDAGSDWLEFSDSTCPMGEHCSSRNIFQNIYTGHVLPDPAVQGGHKIANLDSPQLAEPVCSPPTVPRGFNIFTDPGPGILHLDGSFALASSPGPRGGSRTYLEECGTRLHELLETANADQQLGPLAANLHALVWQQTQLNLHVEFLPSFKRYLVRLPRGLQVISALALTATRLYVASQSGKLWVAPFPTGPPPALHAP
jgi:hypothetical protein